MQFLNTKKPHKKTSHFPVVGIGASAGGFEAFTNLLKSLPNNTGMAFVLVQHLDPHHPSQLTELLTKSTSMPIAEIKDNTVLKPDHAYVIPSNTGLEVEKGVLKLSERRSEKGENMAIDHFFRSLAIDQSNHAIGVILSGTGTDGTLGLQEIKTKGGITFVQEENTAKFNGMPHSAAINGAADFILPVEGIAKELIKIGSHPYVENEGLQAISPLLVPTDNELKEIFKILKNLSGVDFTYYKYNTIRRRIQRRLALHKIEKLSEYIAYLKNNPAEVGALYNDVLISVTNFFRQPESFDVLKEKVFPQIIKNKSEKSPIRIWVPGCATGEEVYSLAICLVEFLEERRLKIPIQVFGTDVSDNVIEKARIGMYIENIEIDVSAKRLERFFNRVNNSYQVDKQIREMCIFAKQNILTDPPFSHVDIISCRNLLIYLEPVLQKRVIPIFHYALNPQGYLILGTSESIGEFNDVFSVENKKYKIYEKKTAIGALNLDLRENFVSPRSKKEDKIAPSEDSTGLINIQKEVDRAILNKYTPVGVVVNSNLEIIQFRGHTSPYLEPSPGKASLNLLKMAREGLFVELSNAINKARMELKSVQRKGLRIDKGGISTKVNIEVIPIRADAHNDLVFLILFEDDVPSQQAEPEQQKLEDDSKQPQPKDKEVSQLKQELTATREYLQATIEELESSNEELQVANEEILSNNEELQSVNEELETSKEELQSTNEELITVNEELQNRNVEVNQVNNDLNNLLTSVDIPIIMLDSDLRIRKFTQAAETVMNIIPSDVGRPIGNIRPNIVFTDLEDTLSDVIRSRSIQEFEVQDKQGNWYFARILPYKIGKNQIEGAIMSFVDIDELKKSEIKLARAAAIVDSSDDAIIGQNLDGTITNWNKGAEHLYGYAPHEIIGKSISLLVPSNKQDDFTEILKKLNEGKRIEHYETQRITKDRRIIDVSLTISLIRDAQGNIVGASKIAHDITAKKRAEQNLQFLAKASEILSSSLDYKMTLANISKIAVPTIADWCSIDLINDENDLEQVNVAHKDPDKVKWARELRQANPPRMDAPTGIPNVIRTGKSELYSHITDEMLVAGARNGKELELMRKLGFSSAMIVPLIVQGKTIGGISFITTETKKHYAEDDLVIAEELAKRAGLAIENSKLFYEAQQAIQLRDEFISVASHELKTPVTSLKMYISVIEKQLEKYTMDKFLPLSNMTTQINKLTILINDLLSVSRLQHGKMEFNMEKFDMNMVMKETVDSLQQMSQKHKIEISGGIAKQVYGDKYRISQVITNLVSNAMKYSPTADEVQIHLKAEEDAAKISVKDFGIGINKNHQSKIFSQFYRVTSFEERTYPGLGMGLYIANEIIKRHGGAITIDSQKGKGSTLTFTIPYAG
jgi:two-component system CheB/CheR fusion protein